MKNFFTSVIIPKGEASLTRLSYALSELVEQLRHTVNNIDLDNMTQETVNAIKAGAIHKKSPAEISSGRISDVKKGDIVVVAENENGRLAKITDLYICTRDIPKIN